MKRQVALLLAALALCLPLATTSFTPTAIAKPCSGSYKHGVIDGAHKCLRRGQFCKKAADRQYHRYGFHCHRSGHLT